MAFITASLALAGCTTTIAGSAQPPGGPGAGVVLQDGGGPPVVVAGVPIIDACQLVPLQELRSRSLLEEKASLFREYPSPVMDLPQGRDPFDRRWTVGGSTSNCDIALSTGDNGGVDIQVYQGPFAEPARSTKALDGDLAVDSHIQAGWTVSLRETHGAFASIDAIISKEATAVRIGVPTKTLGNAEATSLATELAAGVVARLNEPITATKYSYTGNYSAMKEPCTLVPEKAFTAAFGRSENQLARSEIGQESRPSYDERGKFNVLYTRCARQRYEFGGGVNVNQSISVKIALWESERGVHTTLATMVDPGSTFSHMFGASTPVQTDFATLAAASPEPADDTGKVKQLAFVVGRFMVELSLVDEGRKLSADDPTRGQDIFLQAGRVVAETLH